MLARFAYGASFIAAALAGLATAEWVAIVADGNYCWAAFGFLMIAGGLGAGIFVLAVVPGWVLYRRRRRGRDLLVLSLAVCSLAALTVEAVLLNCVIPMRGE